MIDSKILYKYRGGDNEIFKRDLESLINNCFWSAALPTLNDPCEAKVNTDEYFEELSLLEHAIQETFKLNSGLHEIRKRMNELLAKVQTTGIFSLSKNYNDELMWSHYAAAHKGFCIGYNMYFLERSLRKYYYNILEVVYAAHPPKIKMLEQFSSKNPLMGMIQLIGTKSLRWATEEEIRIVTEITGNHSYDYRAVDSIYFGWNMPEERKDMMMKELRGRNIKYFQMKMEINAYKFSSIPVIDPYNANRSHAFIAPIVSNAIDVSNIQPEYKHLEKYLFKAVEVARRETFCLEVVMCGFSFQAPADQPVVFVHCQRSDIGYGNFEYTLKEIDYFYNEIEVETETRVQE